MWRFLVIDDSNVKRFLLRDADALLSEREYAAVQEWVEGPYYFHIIRDYFTHTELILAGLWGGCAGILHNAVRSMQEFVAKNADSGRFIDQHYLRENVWPTLRKGVLSHDDLFGFHDAKPFPPHAPNRWNTEKFHVGSNTSYQAIGGKSVLPEGAEQRLIFSSADGTIVRLPCDRSEWRMAPGHAVLRGSEDCVAGTRGSPRRISAPQAPTTTTVEKPIPTLFATLICNGMRSLSAST